MSGIKIVGRIVSTVLTVILAALLICNLYTLAARWLFGQLQPTVFGYSTAVVISGSMSETIEVNDMVVIHRQDAYRTGDIITFEMDDTLVTHRIVAVAENGFVTRGDANNTEDRYPVTGDRIIGKVVFVIPGVGWLINFCRTPLGMLCLVLVGLLLLELPAILEYIEKKSTDGGGGNGQKKAQISAKK